MSQVKPLYQAERKLEYQRHLQRLSSIGRERRGPPLLEDDFSHEMHRIRNRSMHFHAQRKIDYLNQQNDKLINKLLTIARGRGSTQIDTPKIQQFENPARRRMQREIERSNRGLAERILSKQSEFEPAQQKRNIEHYEQVKRMMQRNKKASLPQLTSLSRSRSLDPTSTPPCPPTAPLH